MKIQDIFMKKISSCPAFWMMRQAGRYLPEYLEIRQSSKDFMDFCFSKEKVVEATLQPLKRFNLDAAIIFSDILVIPHVLGQLVTFEKNHGPVLAPLDLNHLKQNSQKNWLESLSVVYESLKEVRKKLKETQDLFGFCGTPWTVACYMLEGKKSSNGEFEGVKILLEENPNKIKEVIEFLTPIMARHLIEQQKSGATIVQIFDSWASLVPPPLREDFLFTPLRKIIKELRSHCGETFPIIYFGRGISDSYSTLSDLDLFVGFQVDQGVNLEDVRQKVGNDRVLQGNLDPELLVQGGESLIQKVQDIKNSQEGLPFIFNLGHGILPHTPIPHVELVLKTLQEG